MATVYEVITDRIIEQLEKGVVPWRKPWTNGEPANLVSKKAYRGINAIMLNCAPFSSPYWVTFNQAKQLGGSVRKGAKGWPVVFWIFPTDKQKAEAKAEGRSMPKPTPRYSTVFNLDQCDDITAPASTRTPESDRIAAAEAIVANMPKRPAMTTHANAWYRPDTDTVGMPAFCSFESAERFYATLFHELTHSTGHTSRLDRAGITGTIQFGSETYAQEELVAEMGAAMLCATTGIDNVVEHNAAYVANWLKALKNDRRMVIFAAAQAQKAADYIRGQLAAESVA